MKFSSRRSRRHRNAHTHEGEQRKPFFSNKQVAVQTKEEKPFFQAKLTVGKPGDKYEQEADSVANAVVNQSGGRPEIQQKEISRIQKKDMSRMEEDKAIQEKPEVQKMNEEEEPVQAQTEEEEPVQAQAEEEEVQMQEGSEEEELQMQQEEEEPIQQMEEEEEPVQAKAKTGNSVIGNRLSSRIKDKSGTGRPLPGNTRTEMEGAFGADFSQVNIHTDAEAVQMNKELGAQAFTHGKDIYFNTGKFNAENTSGKELLAHELTHVVQQGKAGPKAQIQKSPSLVKRIVKEAKFWWWWFNFPAGSADDVKKKIGGRVDAGWIKNTCAIRMSRVLNYSGMQIPHKGKSTISGADKKWYFYRIKNLKPYIESHLGVPTYSFDPPYDMTELSKLKGIILFDVKVWSDATGHFTLWNGKNCADKCYFDKASKIYLWLP